MIVTKKDMKKKGNLGQLMIPLIALAALVIFNLIRDPGFFSVSISSTGILAGNLVSVIDSASELAIIAMGMTLVTAACGGQDISVGAVGAIAGSIFVCTLQAMGPITIWTVLLGIFLCIVVAILFCSFNGTLVSVFKIQPMIATLILFSCGRSIAYWFSGSATPQLNSPTIPGIPVPTSIFIVIIVGILLWLVFKFTNLRLYTQSVGINQGAARLNGINPVLIKMLSFLILGVCVAVAGVIGVCRIGQIAHQTLLVEIEMDAILAVAIGGNNLGGGRFRIAGSILGAYIIKMLTITLYAMNVAPVNVKAYKAIVIILIVCAGSPVIRERITALMNRIRSSKKAAAARG